jgi:hypothetical protein
MNKRRLRSFASVYELPRRSLLGNSGIKRGAGPLSWTAALFLLKDE